MTRRIGPVIVAALMSFAIAAPTVAQVTTGTFVGTVRDPSGIVPGATVTVREVNRGTSSTYVTDETGSYTAPFLSPGTYAIEVNVPGFRKWLREGVILQVNQRARVDVSLEIGGIQETTRRGGRPGRAANPPVLRCCAPIRQRSGPSSTSARSRNCR